MSSTRSGVAVIFCDLLVVSSTRVPNIFMNIELMLASVRSKHNLRFYAVKVLNKEKIVRMKQESHTRNEQMMLQAVQHPFIINLWGTFQDTANLYMVMDFVPGGELFTLLRRSNVCIMPFLIHYRTYHLRSASPTPSPSSTPPKSPWH